MNKQTSFYIVLAILVILASNYATFWATTQIKDKAVLQEKLDKYEQITAVQAGALTDGPKAQ